ncbi:MAG: NUDIX domain-containing protein, partial [Tepidiformaceae bacterium]
IGVATPEDTEGLRARLHLLVSEDVVAREAIEVNEGLDFQYWLPDEAAELPMNPPARRMLARFINEGHYATLVALRAQQTVGVAVIEIDRWGRFLLQLRDEGLERFPGYWTVPGGRMEPGESPDATAFREFEEETGHLLDTVRLFKVYRREVDLPSAMVDVQHVYYIDADIDEEAIEVREGQAFRYFRPDELQGLKLTPYARQILGEFVPSTAYRGMFH